jgi:tetratricopeptide (TPR) repeat protein
MVACGQGCVAAVSKGLRVRQPRHFSAREFLERCRTDTRLRQRAGALAGVCFVFIGVLVGLGRLLLIVAGMALVAGVVALVARSVQRRRPARFLRSAHMGAVTARLATARTQARPIATETRAFAARSGGSLAEAATSLWNRARALRQPATAQQQAVPDTSSDETYGWPYAGSEPLVESPARAEPRTHDERRRALELNARGAQLRRAGSTAPAVALHLEALEIFQALEDRHAQAPTLNSLALALAASGDTDAAVERFEQSLQILREREEDDPEQGNDPEEGKVIANLGFTLLKQGADDRGRELLSEALEKLPPESPAAHQVEAQLRRAS